MIAPTTLCLLGKPHLQLYVPIPYNGMSIPLLFYVPAPTTLCPGTYNSMSFKPEKPHAARVLRLL